MLFESKNGEFTNTKKLDLTAKGIICIFTSFFVFWKQSKNKFLALKLCTCTKTKHCFSCSSKIIFK